MTVLAEVSALDHYKYLLIIYTGYGAFLHRFFLYFIYKFYEIKQNMLLQKQCQNRNGVQDFNLVLWTNDFK